MGSFDTVEMFTIHIINNVYSGYKVTSFLPNIFFILIKMALSRKIFEENAKMSVSVTELLRFLHLFTIIICHLNDWHLFCLHFNKNFLWHTL